MVYAPGAVIPSTHKTRELVSVARDPSSRLQDARRRFRKAARGMVGMTKLLAALIFLVALLFFDHLAADLPVLREMRGIIF